MPHQLNVAQRRAALAATGQLKDDFAQARVSRELDALSARIGRHKAKPLMFDALSWIPGRKKPAPDLVKGLYIWGAVGRGKTMLMDMFFESAPEPRKKRVHFHAFMADVQERLHRWRQAAKDGHAEGNEPIAPVAASIAAEARLLCFDEFSVTDIADAMILSRLFSALWSLGVIVVATSNVEPGRLYECGLNRALFLPFIDLLEKHMQIEHLAAAEDFRLEKLKGQPVYYVPADARAMQALDAAWESLTAGAPVKAVSLELKARRVKVEKAAGGVARFHFAELCGRPLGASDYIEIAQQFHTVIVDGIPAMGFAQRNDAKRFIILIDVLYEQHVKLLASADAEPGGLYDAVGGYEALEFARTSSRLMEMRSTEYLAHAHGAEFAVSADQPSG